MKNFLSQIKIAPTYFGFMAVVLLLLFWLQEPGHPHIVELSVAMVGMIGALITLGLFSGQQRAGKFFFMSLYIFMAGFTWILYGSGVYIMEFGPGFFLVCASMVALTPYRYFQGYI